MTVDICMSSTCFKLSILHTSKEKQLLKTIKVLGLFLPYIIILQCRNVLMTRITFLRGCFIHFYIHSRTKKQTFPLKFLCFSSISVSFIDVYRVHLSGCKPVSAATHLYGRPDSPLHQQEDRRDASTHLCHRWQLLLQHATQQQRPVLYHKVRKPIRLC